MKIRKVTGILLAAVLTFSMAGCGAVSIDGETNSSSEEASASYEGSGAIGLSISTQNNPFFVTLKEGAQAAADEKDVELIVVDAGDNPAKQSDDIDDLISKNISVLIVNPVDSDAATSAVKNAIAKGIKVVSVDRVVNGVEVDCAIASDNVAGAQAATEYLISLVGEGAKVAEIQGTTGASATIDRGEGFHLAADEKVDVVASQTASFSRSEGMTVMENMLQANADIQGVFAHNDEMALGAVEAIGGKDIKVVGFDATDDALAAVAAGRMAATVAQKPDLMGATAVETAVKLIAGETVEKEVPVEVELVTE